MSGLYRLRPGFQHYVWGDTEFIPDLLGLENAGRRPFAELWMGAHPDLPSDVEIDGAWISLTELIRQSPTHWLGPDVARRFDNRLPYLFKVLSASLPLSVQTHPNKDHARQGFARESAAGIPIDAPNRNYKDENHKPELIAALTDFYGLRGFQPLSEITRILRETPELASLASRFEPTHEGLKQLYAHLMTLSQGEVNSMLEPLLRQLRAIDRKTPFAPSDREYWLLRADEVFSEGDRRDRGLFSILLLNLVHLRPSEAMYLPAGVLHAYLRGSGMEIMANSNNVLRGGFTAKHMDVSELLRNITFQGAPVEIIKPVRKDGSAHFHYESPSSEFQLDYVRLDGHETARLGRARSLEIMFVADANAGVSATALPSGSTLQLHQGESAVIAFDTRYEIESRGSSTVYRACVPH